MENWLKGLVAVTCLTILSSTGYRLWNEYRAAAAETAAAEQAIMSKVCDAANKEGLMWHLLPYDGHVRLAAVLKKCDAAGRLDPRLERALKGDGPLAAAFKDG